MNQIVSVPLLLFVVLFIITAEGMKLPRLSPKHLSLSNRIKDMASVPLIAASFFLSTDVAIADGRTVGNFGTR